MPPRPDLHHTLVFAIGFAVTLVLGWPSSAQAQECECDHRIELDQRVVNGTDLGVEPGDRVCVIAGEREFLRLESFRGTAEDPVTIINCGGLVRIHNEDRAYALVTEEGSQHFRITGTGDPELRYGFEISAPDKDPYPGVGLWLLGKSSDYEVDHLEIHSTGFAGVSAKTDPLCDGSADQDVFVQRNARIHDLYVHDTGGEGFYIGSTQVDGHTINCDGNQEVHQPHWLDGVHVYNNVIENTGWDGAQIGMARTDCKFFNNVIRNVGLEGIQYQQQGLQIGTFSQCEIWGNVLETGPTNGIFMQGAHNTRIWNNVVRGFGNHGIYANDQDRDLGATWEFYHNTIGDYGENAITVFGDLTIGNQAINNLVIGPEPGIAAGNDVDWTETTNLVFPDAAAARLTSSTDYTPVEGSPAIGAGTWLEQVNTDLNGSERPDPPSVGAYELNSIPGGDMGVPDFGPPMDANDPDMTASDASGDTAVNDTGGEDAATVDAGGDASPEEGNGGDGCGCSQVRGATSIPEGGAVLLLLIVLTGRRFRRQSRG